MDEITHVGFGDLTYKSGPDGSMFVYGKATGPDLDLDRQICDADWLKTAMPQWMATGANVREMHQSVAAGIGLELSANGNDWMLKSEVVDDNTKKKVEKGVLKGYSIGIKGARIIKSDDAPNGRIVGGQIVEVSLVDRPANPTALVEIAKVYGGELEIAKGIDLEPLIPDTQQSHADIANINQEVVYHDAQADPKDADSAYPATKVCPACEGTGSVADTNETCAVCEGSGKHPDDWPIRVNHENERAHLDLGPKAVEADVAKKDYSEKERATMEGKGQAMEGGAYPIKTVADLKNAIQSFGRAKDKAATKAHIKTRAAALGREDLLPDNWKGADVDVAKAGEMTHNADDLNSVRQSLINLIKAELDEMARGEENEVADVSQLLCALDLFLCWWDGEASENQTDSPFMDSDEPELGDAMSYIGLGVSADLIKSATALDATNEVKDELRLEIVKALGLEEAITTKAEVSKAKEEIALLKAALDEVREMATPGGPVLRATNGQVAKAADAERLQSEAGRFRRLADEVFDPAMKSGYLAKALALETDATALLRN